MPKSNNKRKKGTQKGKKARHKSPQRDKRNISPNETLLGSSLKMLSEMKERFNFHEMDSYTEILSGEEVKLKKEHE
jgi:hypothetical protein